MIGSACGGFQNGEVAADDNAAVAVHAGPLEGIAARFGKFQQQWVNKLAVALAASFTRLSDIYRRSLSAFAATAPSVGCAAGAPSLETAAAVAPSRAGFIEVSGFRAK